MKIRSIILVLGFLLTIEKNLAQGLEFELFLRPSLTSLRGNEMAKEFYDPTIYPSTGAGVTFLFNKTSSLNLGILYDKKGAHGDNETTIRDSQNEIIGHETYTVFSDFDYITVPIQWGHRFGKKIQYQLGVGLYSAFLLKEESGLQGLSYTDDTKEDYTDTYKRFDMGISSSFNVYIPINDSFAFKIGVDDNLGLLNTRASHVKGEGTIKHNSIGLAVGLKYALLNP
ncbi:MAG TPA: porin family protein [Chryseolinea sp.]|nr:porin family protein [Chryseolinea sp.]